MPELTIKQQQENLDEAAYYAKLALRNMLNILDQTESPQIQFQILKKVAWYIHPGNSSDPMFNPVRNLAAQYPDNVTGDNPIPYSDNTAYAAHNIDPYRIHQCKVTGLFFNSILPNAEEHPQVEILREQYGHSTDIDRCIRDIQYTQPHAPQSAREYFEMAEQRIEERMNAPKLLLLKLDHRLRHFNLKGMWISTEQEHKENQGEEVEISLDGKFSGEAYIDYDGDENGNVSIVSDDQELIRMMLQCTELVDSSGSISDECLNVMIREHEPDVCDYDEHGNELDSDGEIIPPFQPYRPQWLHDIRAGQTALKTN